MSKKHYSKKSYNRREKRGRRKRSRKMLFLLFVYLRAVIEYIIDKICQYFTRSKKQIVPPTKNPILLQSVVSLAKSIRERTLTSEEIVRTFIERAREVNPIINAIVDERFEDAIQEAKQIDLDIANGKITNIDFERRPLLGLPFTSKDSTACKGMLHTFGLLCRKNERAKEDADVVKLFKEAGAILIATTNIPEVNMWQETRNMLIGCTNNPYDTTRTVGGSSGGEASLIASCGSLMGIGTDIGGSLRMPAYFCGIFAHKTTNNIISTKGLTNRTGMEVNTMVSPGPMCRFASDLTPMLKVLVGDKKNILKLDEFVNVNEINLFYIPESNCVRSSKMSSEVSAMMHRVVDFLAQKLKDSENAPKQVYFDEMKYSFRLWRHQISLETFDFAAELTNRKGKASAFTEIFKKLIGQSDYTLGAIYNLINLQIFPSENAKWAEETLAKLKSDVLETLGQNGVLLFPSYPQTAPFHYIAFQRPYNYSYWCIFNALRLPVTQVPLGLASDGLPLGIQLVTAPHNDHLTIALAKVLEEEFGGWVPFLETKKEM